MKRLTMPRHWPLSKKAEKFVVRPCPGPHGKMECIPLQIILRDVLGYAESAVEARKILNQGKILVDKKTRKEAKFPVGLMDVIEIPDAHEYYRVDMSKNGLYLDKIQKHETEAKLCRINKKTVVKGGIFQLGLHDGRCILTKSKSYNVGDSVLIGLPKQNIIKHFKLHSGEEALIIAGKNMGTRGKVKDVNKRESILGRGTVKIESHKKEIGTLKDYVMVGNPKVSK